MSGIPDRVRNTRHMKLIRKIVPPGYCYMIRSGLFAMFAAGVISCERDENPSRDLTGATSPAEVPEAPPPAPPIERLLERRWRVFLANSGQQIFNEIHPVGEVTGTKLHELEVKWKGGVRTNREADIAAIAVRYSVFWEGPINKEGYTKLLSVYDAELERITATDLLASNGITNSDVMEGVGIAIGVGIQAAMQSE